jgi:CMP-N,N'-diacetyllegionaminic acid synthase
MKVLGIIGIRSGSKGVKDKNIKLLFGKPLVKWIIDTAQKSKSINRLIVSTDSIEYARIVKAFGVEVPCLRPSELALDHSTDIEYVIHMLEWLKKNEGYVPDVVIRLMATVPMQESEDIDALIEILKNDKFASSAVVISESRQHPMKALKIMDDGLGATKLVNYFTETGRDVTPVSRQQYPKAYFRSNIVASRIETIYNTNTLTGDIVKYHIIPQDRAIDIDNEVDFMIIESLLKLKKIR